MAPSSFLAALVVLGPKVVGGAFTVTANRGAPSFVGLELLAAPFAFSRRDFVVDAPVQLTRDAEWSTRACPPSYLGNASLAGVIVIHADAQWTACSFEQYAVAAGRLGAVLWAQWDADLAMRGMRPGMMKHHWQQGDARALASPVALDLTQDAGVPFIHALASGRIEAVRARVTADQSEWEELFASARFAAWRAVLIIGSAAVLELAACRLYAFARADRGLKCTLGNVVLGTELLLNSERVLYLALDPLSSNGRVEIRLGVYLHSMHVPLSTVTTALFFIFFVEAARSEGLAPHGLAKTSYKRALVAFVAAVLCLDVCTTALVTHTVNRGIVLAHRFVSPVVMPIFNTIVALNIAQRARAGRSLASLAPVTLGRLLNVVRTTAMCSASTAVCSLLLGCGLSFRPLPAFWVTLVQWLALDAISYGQCDAFFPPGVRVPRGPLRRVLTKTLRMHCRLARVALVRAERVRAKLAPARLNPAHSGRAIIPAESRLTRFESDPSKQHLLLGVSPHFLRDFMNARGISSVESTYDVAEVVRALTLRSGKSIAETNAGTRDSEGNLAVGRANLVRVMQQRAQSARRAASARAGRPRSPAAFCAPRADCAVRARTARARSLYRMRSRAASSSSSRRSSCISRCTSWTPRASACGSTSSVRVARAHCLAGCQRPTRANLEAAIIQSRAAIIAARCGASVCRVRGLSSHTRLPSGRPCACRRPATRRERRCQRHRRRGRADWRRDRRPRPLARAGVSDSRVVPVRAGSLRAGPTPICNCARARWHGGAPAPDSAPSRARAFGATRAGVRDSRQLCADGNRTRQLGLEERTRVRLRGQVHDLPGDRARVWRRAQVGRRARRM